MLLVYTTPPQPWCPIVGLFQKSAPSEDAPATDTTELHNIRMHSVNDHEIRIDRPRCKLAVIQSQTRNSPVQ